jgi:hypothetical protein
LACPALFPSFIFSKISALGTYEKNRKPWKTAKNNRNTPKTELRDKS